MDDKVESTKYVAIVFFARKGKRAKKFSTVIAGSYKGWSASIEA